MALAVERRIHPNTLSYIRMYAALPQALLILWSPTLGYIALGFLIATDWADGRVAKSTDRVSNWGAIIDPLADKVLVYCNLAVLLPLSGSSLTSKEIGFFMAMFVMDTLSTFDYLERYKGSRPRHANPFGKFKTASCFGLVIVLAAAPNESGLIKSIAILALISSGASLIVKLTAKS